MIWMTSILSWGHTGGWREPFSAWLVEQGKGYQANDVTRECDNHELMHIWTGCVHSADMSQGRS